MLNLTPNGRTNPNLFITEDQNPRGERTGPSSNYQQVFFYSFLSLNVPSFSKGIYLSLKSRCDYETSRGLLSGVLGHSKGLSNRVLLVGGCTNTGKSALGINLAKRVNGEIINCDVAL